MISKEEINKKIKSAFWDYNVDSEIIYLIAIGKRSSSGYLTREKIMLRLFERLSWYELIDIFSLDYLKENLTVQLIEKIRNSSLRQKYEFIRQILQGKTISSSGWSDKNSKRLKASILSDRWYSA